MLLKRFTMRGGMGLGDALYVRCVAEHFARMGHKVTVATAWPDVFIGADVSTTPFTRQDIQVLAHYSDSRFRVETTQFRDMCLRAGLKEDVPLRFDWTPKNAELLQMVRERAAGRPVLIVHGGREPFGRDDGLGLDLIPKADAFEAALSGLRDCLTVSIGDGKRQSYLPAVELDLIGKTSVTDVLDLGRICDGIVAQVSFCVPLAECFDKPFLGVWAAKGMYKPSRPLLGTVTPAKILTKDTSLYVVDDWDDEDIGREVGAFRLLAGSR